MNPTDQRIAIAEACGWVYLGSTCLKHKAWKNWYHHKKTKFRRVPDYPNDLNAMAEAEAVMDERDLTYHYGHFLYNIVVPFELQPFRASAAHRAEAFLRTLNLWIGGKLPTESYEQTPSENNNVRITQSTFIQRNWDTRKRKKG